MFLTSTLQKLQVQLAGAKATLDCPITIDFVDISGGTLVPGEQITNTNGVTVTDILTAPAALYQRKVNGLSLNNIDTAPITATIIYNDNGTNYKQHTVTLQIGDVLTYTDQQGWVTFNGSGGAKSSEIGKKLCQGAIGTGAGTLLFTATNKTELTCIDVCNTTAASITLLLHLVPVGIAVGTTNQLIPTITIKANSMWQWTGSQVLNLGDFIQGIGSGAGLTINASGKEIT